MTHIAIAEMQDGKVVEWLEHVTDEQYGKSDGMSPMTEGIKCERR
jgi:hypothetical protein